MRIHRLFIMTLGCGMFAATSLRTCETLLMAQTPASMEKSETVTREGAWEVVHRENELTTIRRRVLHLAPKSETKPALSIQLIPNYFHASPGNAAIFYLKAGGFFEQPAALNAKLKSEEDARKADPEKSAPPLRWLDSELKDLPVDQVKEYLKFTEFQSPFLEEAWRRRVCDFDRQIKEIESPISFLLPEIQSIRETARLQGLRFMLALAENRTDDAVKTLGQLIAMGPHLSQEPFLVSNLVGIACVGIGLNQAHYLSERDDAPNLYWAIASLPHPLVSVERSLSYEREFLFEQVKILREVDEQPKSEDYWKHFNTRFLKDVKYFGSPLSELEATGSFAFTLAMGANVPKAREYLISVEGMKGETLNGLPNAQIFYLAVRRFYERYRDEEFKFFSLPPHALKSPPSRTDDLDAMVKKYGLFTTPAALLLPGIQAATSASQRLEQQLALWQTIESIRHHLDQHDHLLPASLEQLDLPAPNDPVTQMPFRYVVHDQGATLSGSPGLNMRYQFELRVAPKK